MYWNINNIHALINYKAQDFRIDNIKWAHDFIDRLYSIVRINMIRIHPPNVDVHIDEIVAPAQLQFSYFTKNMKRSLSFFLNDSNELEALKILGDEVQTLYNLTNEQIAEELLAL